MLRLKTMFSICLLTILASFTDLTFAADTEGTRIFIDQVTEYQLLATCAELQVSTIVRDMSYGCGDGGATTSFACFCFESSAKFSSMISAHVVTACKNSTDSGLDQASTAVDVFSSYCELGKVAPTASASATTGSPSQSSSASPASGPATIVVTATPSTSSQPEKKKDTPVVAIAVGVTVPVVAIGLGIIAILLYRRYKKKRQEPIELAAGTQSQVNEAFSGDEVRELKEDTRGLPPAELASPVHHELDSPKANFVAHELDSQVRLDSRPREKS